MNKLNVNIVSESEFTVQGHGVHTAFLEMKKMLIANDNLNLEINALPKRDFDLTHIHTVGTFSLRHLYSKHSGKKIVSAHIVPASLIGSLVGANFWLAISAKYLRWFYNKADLVIAVSQYTKSELLKLGVTVPITVLENSIETTKYKTSDREKLELRKKLGFNPDDFIVVGNGQIQPRKRFCTFYNLAKKLPELQFVWIGGMPFKFASADFFRLNKIMKNLPQNLQVTDVVSLDTAGKYMRSANVMFTPSIQETFGLAILEGAASGLPVLVHEAANYNSTFGNLVLRGNESNFSEKLIKLKNDKEFAKTWQQNSEKLAQKYDSEIIADNLVKLYRELMQKTED